MEKLKNLKTDLKDEIIMKLVTKPDNQTRPDDPPTLSFDQLVDRVLMNSGIPEKWIKKRFLDLTGDKNYLKIISMLKSWDFKKPVIYTMLSKSNGVGKTHVATCLIRKFVYNYLLNILKSDPERDLSGLAFNNIFVYDSVLYRRIQESYKDRAQETETSIINELTRKPFLVIDDLFSSRDNDFARKVILDIINIRVDWLGLPTFVTSNLSRNKIRTIDPRIDSRLNNGFVIEIDSVKTDHRKA